MCACHVCVCARCTLQSKLWPTQIFHWRRPYTCTLSSSPSVPLLFCAMMTTTTVLLSRFFNSQNLRLFVVLRKHTAKCLTRANNSNINSNSNQIKYYSAPHLTALLACLHACMHVCFAVCVMVWAVLLLNLKLISTSFERQSIYHLCSVWMPCARGRACASAHSSARSLFHIHPDADFDRCNSQICATTTKCYACLFMAVFRFGYFVFRYGTLYEHI